MLFCDFSLLSLLSCMLLLYITLPSCLIMPGPGRLPCRYWFKSNHWSHLRNIKFRTWKRCQLSSYLNMQKRRPRDVARFSDFWGRSKILTQLSSLCSLFSTLQSPFFLSLSSGGLTKGKMLDTGDVVLRRDPWAGAVHNWGRQGSHMTTQVMIWLAKIKLKNKDKKQKTHTGLQK